MYESVESVESVVVAVVGVQMYVRGSEGQGEEGAGGGRGRGRSKPFRLVIASCSHQHATNLIPRD